MLPLLAQLASAQDTVEIGVIDNDDIHVVQDVLYPKVGRSELNFALGLMPFDPYLTTPNVQIGWDTHAGETLAFGAVVGGGYGFKTAVHRQLESPTFGVAPYAYRYLTSVLGGATWSPIYAKMSLGGASVVHFDIYGAARAGVSITSSVIPQGGIAVAPTVSPAIGMRFFVGERGAFRWELRDDVLFERRKLTDRLHVKQNANIMFGWSFLSKVKGK